MKKSSKRIAAAVLALLLSLSLAACGGNSGAPASPGGSESSDSSSGEKIVIRIASSSPTVEFEGEGTTSLGISTNYFIKEIEARTNGRITAQVFPDGQIASSTQEYIGGLQNGAFDMGILNCGSWADYPLSPD